MFFLIPYGHDRGFRRLPLVTLAIMASCVIVQIFLTMLPRGELSDVFHEWGFVPYLAEPATWVTHAFLHGGFLHLLGNLLFLWLAGATLEDRWGRPAFAAFYLLGAPAAALAYLAWHPDGITPAIGASGAIAAAMGAFLLCFHDAQIRIAYVFFFGRFGSGTFTMPAYLALPLWFAGEAVQSIFEAGGSSGVAYSAHVGGFVFGLATALALKKSGLDARLAAASDFASETVVFEAADAPPRRPAAAPEPARREPTGDAVLLERCRTALRGGDRDDALVERVMLGCARNAAFGTAIEIWEEALALPGTPSDRCFAAAARLYEAADRPWDALETLRSLVRMHPGSELSPRAFLDAARILADTLGDEPSARTVLETLIAKNPPPAFTDEARRRIDRLG